MKGRLSPGEKERLILIFGVTVAAPGVAALCDAVAVQKEVQKKRQKRGEKG